jgi:hypothetical protein
MKYRQGKNWSIISHFIAYTPKLTCQKAIVVTNEMSNIGSKFSRIFFCTKAVDVCITKLRELFSMP